MAAVVEQSFLLFLLQLLQVLLRVVLNADEVENISQKGMFDFAVHG